METLNTKLGYTKFVYWSLRGYNVALDFIVAFMLGALIFQIIGVNLAFAILPAVFYAMVQLGKQYARSDLVREFEGKYDGLDQRLQTAIEYQGTKNIIVEDLLSDVSKRMDNVETSTFLNSKALSRRVYAIVVLSFLLLTATVLDLRSVAFDGISYLMDTANLNAGLQKLTGQGGNGFNVLTGDRWESSNFSTDKSKDKLGAKPGGTNPGVSEGPIPGKGSGTGADGNKDIYGTAKSANIAGKDVDFRLHPEYGGDIEIRETGTQTADKAFQLDQVQSVDECPDCVVGPEHEEMVRKYFEKILPEG